MEKISTKEKYRKALESTLQERIRKEISLDYAIKILDDERYRLEGVFKKRRKGDVPKLASVLRALVILKAEKFKDQGKVK